MFPVNVYAVGQIFTKFSGKPKDADIEFCSSKKKTDLENSGKWFNLSLKVSVIQESIKHEYHEDSHKYNPRLLTVWGVEGI